MPDVDLFVTHRQCQLLIWNPSRLGSARAEVCQFVGFLQSYTQNVGSVLYEGPKMFFMCKKCSFKKMFFTSQTSMCFGCCLFWQIGIWIQSQGQIQWIELKRFENPSCGSKIIGYQSLVLFVKKDPKNHLISVTSEIRPSRLKIKSF